VWLLVAVPAVSINVPVTMWCLVGGRKASAFHSTGLARRQFTFLKLCRNSALSQMSSPLFDDVTGDHLKNRRNRQRLPCTGLQRLLQLAFAPPDPTPLFSFFLSLFSILSFWQSGPPLHRSWRSPVPGPKVPRFPVPGSPDPRSPVCNPKDQFRRYHSNSL